MQRRLMLKVSLFPTIALAVTTLVVAVFCHRLSTEAMRTDADLPSLIPLLVSLLGFTLVAVAIVIYQALRFSNRVAGPVWRIMASMRRIHDGDRSFRVRLRRGDHLEELADAFNEHMDWLDTQLAPGQPEEDPPITAGTSRPSSASAAGTPRSRS